MARALALTAECLDCAAGTPSTGDAGGTGPSIIPRNIPLPDVPVSGGLPIVPGTTGDRPVTVLPGTSALPSSGPQVQPQPPAAQPTSPAGPPWGLWLGLGALLALLVLSGRGRQGAR